MSADSARAVFLSYASQDAAAARRICDALREAGVEVWFDQSELRGGDAWDQKIRNQIKECALFVPVISAHTQARPEGYFRLEWKLAVDRSHLMADDEPFIVPVVIDDTPQSAARVPEKFQALQWTRLVMTETPGAFANRVQTLLAGRGNLDSGAGAVRNRGEVRSVQPRRDRRWPIGVAIAGVVVALLFVARSWWSLNTPMQVTAKAETKAAPPLSEARQLTAKARALMQKFDSGADDLAAAEGYIKRALELDANDAEIWAASSLLNFSFRSRGFDRSSERNAAARSHAERALKLDPDSVEGLFALARWQRDNEEPAVAEATFKKVLARDPNHTGALTSLGYLYDRIDRVDDAAAVYARAAAHPESAALARYTEFLMYFRRGRFAEADRAVRQSIAVQPSANSQAGLAMLLLTWKGDAEGAAEAVASGPASTRNEHRIIWVTTFVHLVRRKPDDALLTLRRLSDEYIHDNWFTGPSDYFVGRAHWQAGRKEAARLAWEAGLELTRTRLKTAPTDQALHLMQGELLALLGQRDEALREAHLTEELQRFRPTWVTSSVRIYAQLGLADKAVPVLRALRSELGENNGWPLTAALLRLDPLWDKIRDDANFQQLLSQPD